MEDKRGFRISEQQRISFIEFMTQHPQLISGKFTATFTASTAKLMWNQVEQLLNSMPGAKKDWRQWRKSWHDMKTKVKSKNARIKNYHRGTGGGAPLGDILTSWEEGIVNLIGPTASLGHPAIEESLIIESNMDTENTDDMVLQDRSYLDTVLQENVIEEQEEEEEEVITVITVPETVPSTPNAIKPKTPTRRQNLENSTEATRNLTKTSEQRNNLVGDYYQKKLYVLQEANELKKKKNETDERTK